MARRKTVERDRYGRLQSTWEEEETEDALDARGLLKDGRALRIPLYLKDKAINPNLTATQRAIAATHQHSRPLVNDGTSKPNALNRPGFRYLADNKQRALDDAVKNEAYQEVDRRAANAWKGATNRTNRFSDQEGDPCTVRGPEYPDDFGSPGTLQIGGDGELVCVPDNLQDARRQDAKQSAYAAYDREMANAWRGDKTAPNYSGVQDRRAGAVTDVREAYRLYDEEQQNAWRGSNR